MSARFRLPRRIQLPALAEVLSVGAKVMIAVYLTGVGRPPASEPVLALFAFAIAMLAKENELDIDDLWA